MTRTSFPVSAAELTLRCRSVLTLRDRVRLVLSPDLPTTRNNVLMTRQQRRNHRHRAHARNLRLATHGGPADGCGVLGSSLLLRARVRASRFAGVAATAATSSSSAPDALAATLPPAASASLSRRLLPTSLPPSLAPDASERGPDDAASPPSDASLRPPVLSVAPCTDGTCAMPVLAPSPPSSSSLAGSAATAPLSAATSAAAALPLDAATLLAPSVDALPTPLPPPPPPPSLGLAGT